jgi:type II secretory pathway pseudopilin PulG
MKLKLFKNKKGFTFIELILGMGIVVFLSAAMFQIISVSNTQQGLNNNTEKVKALLRLAQSYSLSIPQDEVEPKHICGFGIYGTETSEVFFYYLYIDDFDNSPMACDNNNNLKFLSSDPELGKNDIQKIDLGNDYELENTDIFFKVPYGKVINTGASVIGDNKAEVTIKNIKTSDEKTIEINSSGKINFQ